MGNLKQRLIKPGRDFNYAEGVKVKNDTGAEIAADKIVYFSGFEGPYIKVTLAQANDQTTSSGRLMITKHAIPDGGYGIALPWKLVTGVATTGGEVGGAVYLDLSSAGAFTVSIPSGADEANSIVPVGVTLTVGSSGAFVFCGEGAPRSTYF